MKGYPKPVEYNVINKHKYIGTYPVIARSSWEKKLMSFLDKHPSILQWMSESIVIPYVSPVDYKMHKYYVDFAVIYKTKDGLIQKALIEVKPNKERLPPKKTKNMQRFLQESETYAINQAKWRAAEAWCKERRVSFLIFDEYSLGLKIKKSNAKV